MRLEAKITDTILQFYTDLLLRPDIYTMDERAVVSRNQANAASKYAITSPLNSCWALINLRGVLVKLLSFSVSLGAVPLISYYVSLTYFYKGMISLFSYSFHLRNQIGNNTLAAIAAVVAANLILITYIITSLLEDREDRLVKDESESKKTR